MLDKTKLPEQYDADIEHRLLVRVRKNTSQISAIFNLDGLWEQVRFQKFTPDGHVYRDDTYTPDTIDVDQYQYNDSMRRLPVKFLKATTIPQNGEAPDLKEQVRRLQSHRYRLMTHETFGSLNELDEDWSIHKG